MDLSFLSDAVVQGIEKTDPFQELFVDKIQTRMRTIRGRRRKKMEILIAAKQTGKEFVIAISTAIGAFINWLCHGKQQDLQREKMGHVISTLEERLRKVEIELLRMNDLPPASIKELKAEKNKLLAEIDAVSRAGWLKSRIYSSSFQ